MTAQEEWAKLATYIKEAKQYHDPVEMTRRDLEADDIEENEFGLTNEEYYFLLDDIDQAIAEANEKWDYSGYLTKPEPDRKQIFARARRISKRSRLTQFLALQRRA